MKKRDTLLALVALAVAPLARAQPSPMTHRIGFIGARARSTPSSPDIYYDAFVQGMRDLGYVEGRNLEIHWRLADGDYKRLGPLANELVRIKPEVVVAHGTTAAQAMQHASREIPIVFVSVNDPVGTGLAASLGRPGANLTGVSNMISDLSQKQVEVMRAAIPRLARAAILLNPENDSHRSILAQVQQATQRFGVQALVVNARTLNEIRSGFSRMAKERADAALIATDAFFLGQLKQIAAIALQSRLPSIYGTREYALEGGLMGYGPNLLEVYRRAASYVDRIFKGAAPAELAIEQPTQVELFINLKTARELRIAVPQPLLLRADRVIE
jgi:putative ABC transport system substrate-binding protein